jgi:hypothetical protein
VSRGNKKTAETVSDRLPARQGANNSGINQRFPGKVEVESYRVFYA